MSDFKHLARCRVFSELDMHLKMSSDCQNANVGNGEKALK